MMPYSVILGLGSNIGNRLQYLQRAVDGLWDWGRIIAVSPVYETEPVGIRTEYFFFNAALILETLCEPHDLLRAVHAIERNLGRDPAAAMNDREIDIDLLLYNGILLRDALLEVPHPRFSERRFALVPANDIAPQFVHPALHRTVNDLLTHCPDQSRVEATAHRLSVSQLSV